MSNPPSSNIATPAGSRDDLTLLRRVTAFGQELAVALCGERGRTGPDMLPVLEGLVALASVALESARLVDLQDEGRRSWQDMVDAIRPALCIVDRGGRIRRANRAFADLVNVSPAS